MALSDSGLIALCRALWPQVTVDAASDAYLTAWLPQAKQLTGTQFRASRDMAMAHLLAHYAVRGDPSGYFGTGGVAGATGQLASNSTAELSASWGNAPIPKGFEGSDLLTTRPGQAWLQIFMTLPVRLPRYVAY